MAKKRNPSPEQKVCSLTRGELVQQRDKHLSQFMEINGKAVFAVVTAVSVMFLGMDDVQNKFTLDWKFYLVGGLMLVGIALLTGGAVGLARFHASQIRRLEDLSAMAPSENAVATVEARASDLYVLPNHSGLLNFVILCGCICLAGSAVLALLVTMLMH